MAKFRFPGKALKLNTRKRVRFRGSHTANTPEELYTRRIRKGLDLFTQIFGDSDEDEDDFEGFLSSQPEARVAGRAGTVPPPRSRAGKRVAQRVEEACTALEEAGLATLRRTSVVEGAVSEVREGGRGRTESVSARESSVVTVAAAPQEPPVQEPSQGCKGEECTQGTKPWPAAASNRVTRKQTSHRISSRQPTVKTALAKKLLAKAKKKVPSLPVVGEKSPKRFILPTMSVRSSRIIKPNKRLFADITEMCSAGGPLEGGLGTAEAGEDGSISVSPKRLVKLTRKGRGSHTQFLSLPRSRAQDEKNAQSGMDGVRRTISIYTEAMTGPCKGQVGRPPKRLLRRPDPPQQEVEAEAPDSPQRCDPKESRVKEKIEKLLRSPWDDRLKQSAKGGGKGEGEELMPALASIASPTLAASALSRSILRKPRLNLNKTTLQRLRNPASLQRFIPTCDGGSVEGKCAVCDIAGEHFTKFGVLFCEVCSSFLDKVSGGPKEVMECLSGSKSECQVAGQGLEAEDRCPACWLYRVLTSCSINNILHDHLRKRLPTHLKERMPTSLARCMSVGGSSVSLEKDSDLASHMKRLPLDPGGGGAFGSVMDLPGGWRRKIGPEVIVISPSGEKFRSVQKLEEFLKKQGIGADARVLFGNNSSSLAVGQSTEVKSKPSAPSNSGSRGKVVMTTLPGGWTRRIKWRSAGDRFDTYVYSPDGRTFRSRRELSAYFNMIGKVDDIHKYFPVVTGLSDASIPSSSDTPGSSSTEPVSSSEPCSEVSSDDKSPEVSECEADQPKHKFQKPPHLSKGKKSKILQVKLLKVQDTGQNRSQSSLSVVEESIGEEDQQGKNHGATTQAKTLEFKQKQKIPSRNRSMSASRNKCKDDTSMTDTTESESEQRKPGTIQIFSKTFSKNRSRKSKIVDSPPLFGNSGSSSCSSQSVKDSQTVCTPQGSLKDTTGDSNDASTPISDIGDVKLSGKKQKKTQEQSSAASPEACTVLAEYGKHESGGPEDGRSAGTKVSVGKKLKRALEQTSSASLDPGEPPAPNNKPTTKIVLKIPKKAIEIKPIRKKLKNRSKHIKGEKDSAVKEEKQPLKLSFLEDKSWETQAPTDTKKLSDVTQGKLPSQGGGEDPTELESDGLADYNMTDKSRVVTSPSMSEGEGDSQAFRVPVVKKVKPQKSSRKYETQHFGQGWTRRIRWNERGEGRVALLYSPDGQTFRSRIELSAYFKKAGKPRADLEYYFPLVLHRTPTGPSLAADKDTSALLTSTSTQSSETSEFSDSDAFIKTSEDSWGSGEEMRRSRLLRPIKYHRPLGGKNSLEDSLEDAATPLVTYHNSGKPSSCLQTFQEDGRKLMPLPSKGGKNIVVSIHEVKTAGGVGGVIRSETEEGEEVLDEAGGPRVKHVCRSQAQVLRITRAVFPSPKKDDDTVNNSGGGSVVKPKLKGDQKRKIVTVTTTTSGKVLRKTQWCSKCPGCTTPNCLKCSNCLDMKKYGGPGTKKKPCIMRKCQNPRLSIKSAGTQDLGGKVTPITTITTTTTTITTTTTTTAITTTAATPLTANSHKDLRKVSLLNLRVQEDKVEGGEAESDSTSKSLQQEKAGVFIPRQMTRTQPDQKDRGDIAAGKQFVPGALVNIDYWQGYDADEMMLTGYPVTTASPLHPQILCFRCGSLGKEQLLYCAWCCEGIHPYCLEDGEGPESEAEEVFWICRRCAVCHVCGAPGADSLLRCSDCRNYYHLECLGPSAHSTCQPTPDRPWKCVTCTRCTSCGSPNVARWQKITQKAKPLEVSLSESSPTTCLALCLRCATLRERGNFCPLCNGCYEDDDYEAKMMECGRCREWVHAHCEGLNNERYQILSFLPDTVEYVCRSCMVDSASSWLDAVSSELLAGCEAVLQALLSSRCAKHLVKRDTSTKLSSSGALTPLPISNTPTLEKTDEGPLDKVEEEQSLGGSAAVAVAAKASAECVGSSLSSEYQPVVLPFPDLGITSTEGSLVVVPTSQAGSVRGPAEAGQVEVAQAMEVDSCCQEPNRPATESASGDNKLLGHFLGSAEVSAKDISQGEAGGLKPTAEQTLCPMYNQAESMAANSNVGRSGCVASDQTDLKEKFFKEKSEEEVQLLPRRQTRSCTAGSFPAAPLVAPAAPTAAGTTTDPIKLKECSVRLEDICKTKSPASSPVKSKAADQDVATKSETQITEEVSQSFHEEAMLQETEAVNTKILTREHETFRHVEEPEGLTHEALHSILPLGDTGVSCTQVDGPNDETTATSRVMRNLFMGDRNQMMLETTGPLDSKTHSNSEKNLAQVEAQIISPKDKITKDIDDDCVSSEESSFCDTDTEIESIQDDPEEPRDLLSVKEKLKEKKYESVLQFHVDMVRIIENGRHLNRSQIRNVQTTYAKHMKECFPWFDVKSANVFDLVDKQRPFPVPHTDHSYITRTLMSGSRHFPLRDAPIFRKRSTSPVKGLHLAPPDRRKCVLCSREGDDDPNSAGRLLYLGQDEWLHVNCGLWSSEVYEEVDGGLQNVYLAVSRGRLIKCSACLERGATVGCCHKSCQATYHFLCARRACCQFMEDKRIFCPQHESVSNGAEKNDDFKVSRCVYVDMDCEKKKWKQVAGNRVSITLGTLTIKNLGRIIPESDSAEALIPVDFVCSRLYWSTLDPSRRVTYTCRTRRVVPTLEDASLLGDAAFHKTIDHSLGEEMVRLEMAAVKKWFKQLEERKVEKKSRETNIIPPHLCPLYRSIREKEEEEVAGARREVRCRTPPSMVEMDVRQCIDDIIDKVSRSVEEESLLLDTDLPAIVSYDDNELISMVLNDLDACDPITLESTPSTSGRPSPLDIDFLSTCDHMMDSGKVTHSGNMTQEAQETDCDPQVIMDTDTPLASGHDVYQVDPTDADVKEPILQTLPPPTTQDPSPVPPSSTSLPTTPHGGILGLNQVNTSNNTSTNVGNSCSSCNNENKSDGGSSSSSSSSNSSNSSGSSSSTSSNSSGNSSSSSSSSSSSGSSSSSEASCNINPTLPSSSPERCSEGTASHTSSPESVSRAGSDHNTSTDTGHGSTDSNSGSETSSQGFSTKSPGASASNKTSSSLKQICRVLPMPSTNSRRSSSTSEQSDSVPHGGQPHQASQQSPRQSDENEGTNVATKGGSERKKFCMKRNLRTVIKKYPLRSGMRKSKPYETVQIEINETIEIPGGAGPGMVHKSLKRKWSGILDSEEEEEGCQKDAGGRTQGQDENASPGSDTENSKENAVSKKVLKFSDDNNDITVSIVNNNNNLCEFSKSRGHRYRHKTVLQLDGAADGSSSSAEMSESQDEGTGEEKAAAAMRSPGQEDPNTPPLHSSLAMRIKEQSLARSSPGEEGPYKCSKCKRLYRTKESCEKHIETCTFEVDSSSTSDEDEEYEDDLHSDEDNQGFTESLSSKMEATPPHYPPTSSVSSVGEFLSSPQELSSSQQSIEGQEISLINNLVSNLEQGLPSLPSTPLEQADDSKTPEFPGEASGSSEEPAVKKQRLDPALPRQPGVHRQVRTAIKKSPSSGEDVELLGVVRGPPPPGTDVFVPPPVSPVKFSPIVKKSASPRRYTNVRLMRGSRGYQYRRAAPHMPPQEHYHGAAAAVAAAAASSLSLPLPPTAPAPIQVTMHPMANTSGQLLTQGTSPFQQFGSQSTQYTPATQLTSPVTHLSPALQVGPQVTQVAPQVSPQVSPLLTMVSTPSVAVPQGYTLQYVGSFRDGEMASGGSSLVTYPAAPVVVPQPQLVMTPQQSSVVMPQVVNTNITYSFTSPDTLLINQPTMVPGMQPVQYLTQQQHQQQHQPQQQQTQVLHQPEHQQVMQYSQTGVSPQQTQMSMSHMHSTQMHAPCIQLSDLQQASPMCLPQQQQQQQQQQHQQQQAQQPPVMSRELSFTSSSKQVPMPQCLIPSPGRSASDLPLGLSATSTISTYSVPAPRPRPQASVAPQVIRPQPAQTIATSQDTNLMDTHAHSRLPFADRPLVGGVRTVATVAPAIITTSVVSISTCSMATKLTSVETTPKIATVRPRPTYSYRDAMREKQQERQKHRQEIIQINQVQASEGHPEFLKEQEGPQPVASDSESDSENENACLGTEEKEDRLETQSYKLVLRKDNTLSSGFNVLPISGPATPLPAPEVKELRIKAKVSVGPKRKKTKNRDPEKDLIIVNKDTTNDLYVNEQLPNLSLQPPVHTPSDDPSLFDKPKTCTTEPYIVFELTSDDGFRVESRHITEVWQKVFDAVAAARASMRVDSKMPSNLQQPGPGGAMSGLHMLGLTHNAVQYLLEQLPGAKDCHKYSFQFHRRPQEEGAVEENPSGCARTEAFKTRSPYDIFSWLASKHRRMPERSLVQQEEIQLSTRRATSLELPMAMRYRHLRETAREAVGVFRSSIHGRGLFCKRDIDAGEMVIEYAGQVIRSSMCDMREKDYESKGIGCYMFRIDDDTVIDATMHGNAARFINHSCDPNCYSRVVDILGKKHIIIFALRRILRGEELTYDYKFPIEEDKIPCTCGTRRCRKYLN